jgi:hypothetical protein
METAVASALPPAASQPVTQQAVFSREETERLLSALAQPFDPSVIKWVVKATSGKDGKRRGLYFPPLAIPIGRATEHYARPHKYECKSKAERRIISCLER